MCMRKKLKELNGCHVGRVIIILTVYFSTSIKCVVRGNKNALQTNRVQMFSLFEYVQMETVQIYFLVLCAIHKETEDWYAFLQKIAR